MVAEIGVQLGRLEALRMVAEPLHLRRARRIETVQASLAIEGNSLNLDQVTAILDGKRVLGPARDIQEVRNALNAYDVLPTLDPFSEADLCRIHEIMMLGLVDVPGKYRTSSVGIQRGGDVVHVAPSADRVPHLVADLLSWLRDADDHALIKSAVFHYEFEFIHPFTDGNGRLGRFWQTLILHQWKPLFRLVPIESVIQEHQTEYYAALRAADGLGEATPFIAFMLDAILTALLDVAVTDQATDQATDQVRALLRVLGNGANTSSSLMKKLSLSHRPTFRINYLKPALEAGLVEMTLPEKPSSPRQQYRLTGRGRKMVSVLGVKAKRHR